MISVAKLQTEAKKRGLPITKHTEYHYQLQGKYLIDVYPTTNRIFIQGMNHSARIFDAEEAVDYASGERFPAGVDKGKRRCNRTVKLYLWGCRPRICVICKKLLKNIDEATVDHKIPLSRGGSNRMDNVQLACAECNHAKGNAV